MNITELNSDKSNYQAKVVVPNSMLEEATNKKLSEIGKTAKLDGFRAGKVPANILKQKYASSARTEVVRDQLDAAIRKIVTDNKLNIAMDPEVTDIKNEDGKDLEFKLQFELMPEIKMPDLKKISIEKPTLTVEEKDVKERLEKISEYSKSYDKEKKTAAKKGDQVTMDAVGYVDSEAFEGGKLDGHKLVLGSGAFIPGFEDQLIGSKAGDDVTVKVDFPKEYHAKNLAGKASEFKVKVLAVHSPVEPKIDDAFAQNLKCKDLADLKEKIKEDIARGYNDSIHVFMKMELFNQLEKLVSFQPPKSMLDKEFEALDQQKAQLLEDETIKAMSEKEQKDYFQKMAFRRVAIGLILAEYVKENKLSVTEDDVKQAIFQQARRYPGQEQQVFEFYQKNKQALESLRGPILEEKAAKAIFDKEVKIKEKAYKRTALDKLLQEQSQA